MRRRIWFGGIALVLSLCLPFSPDAQTGSGCAGVNRPLIPYATETLTVSNAAIGFTTATMVVGGRSPAVAQISTAGDDLRYYPDGTTPTNLLGHILPINSAALVCGPTIGRLKMIRITNDVTVTVTYYAN